MRELLILNIHLVNLLAKFFLKNSTLASVFPKDYMHEHISYQI